MKPKRSVEHVVTDLFAFLGTYDCRDERRILALDAKPPQVFRTFYASYLPLIVTLWIQALQYNQPGNADAVSQAFLDEFHARMSRLGSRSLADEVLRGVAGLPKLLQRENGVVLVAAACVESMTNGNIPKKGKRASLLTQKILKILQFFITRLGAYEVVHQSSVPVPYVTTFFANGNGDGTGPAATPPAPAKTARTPAAASRSAAKAAAKPAAAAAESIVAKPEKPSSPLPELDEPPPVWAKDPSAENKPTPPEPMTPKELPPEPMTSDEPSLAEIEEVWTGDEQGAAAPSVQKTLQAAVEQPAVEDAAPAPVPEPASEAPKVAPAAAPAARPVAAPKAEAAEPVAMADAPDAPFADDDDEDMFVVDAEETDDDIFADAGWDEPDDEDEGVGAGDPYNELGIGDGDEPAVDADMSGFEFEEQEEEKHNPGIDVDEFHDVINRVVTEVLSSQTDSDPDSRNL